MRREYKVITFRELQICKIRWRVGKDVESGARDLPGIEHIVQNHLVDQTASSAVDQDRTSPHPGEGGRAFAGPIQTKISTVGMLWFSAIFSFIGMQLLAGASGSFVFVGAAIFALGITFFWPTTLAFVSENLPQSGAFGLSIMGGLGTLSVSAIMPIMGRVLDNSVGMEAIRTISILLGILIVLYGGLFFLRRSRAKAALSI